MKIQFKKIACLALVLVTTLSLAACDSGKEAAAHLSSAMESISAAKETAKTEESKLEFFYLSGSNSYRVEGIGSCEDKELHIPSQYKGLPVTQIVSDAFEWNNTLTYVNIPGSVTIINSSAFSNSGLTHVAMDEGVEVIESGAFYGCKLRSVTIPSSVVTIASNAFIYNSNLKTVNYLGTMERWNAIAPYNLTQKGITALCSDGVINY